MSLLGSVKSKFNRIYLRDILRCVVQTHVYIICYFLQEHYILNWRIRVSIMHPLFYLIQWQYIPIYFILICVCVDIYAFLLNVLCTTSFWNNLHLVGSISKYLKGKKLLLSLARYLYLLLIVDEGIICQVISS